jgi:hypothetical protein
VASACYTNVAPHAQLQEQAEAPNGSGSRPTIFFSGGNAAWDLQTINQLRPVRLEPDL